MAFADSVDEAVARIEATPQMYAMLSLMGAEENCEGFLISFTILFYRIEVKLSRCCMRVAILGAGRSE
jgi:hypothetical protein